MMWRSHKVAAVLSVTAAVSLVCLGVYRRRKKRRYRQGFLGLVGNTPMIELRSLSEATGCTVLAKVKTNVSLKEQAKWRLRDKNSWGLNSLIPAAP
eukprot:GEMP01042500.1.p2 GENE.GEMP01042500.1~~GEMP01042500.1.p2  ORF type:complete len:103 (+),score=20.26 GEMP01042500.1:22-309(+)